MFWTVLSVCVTKTGRNAEIELTLTEGEFPRKKMYQAGEETNSND
jgi:hypothetical protein